MESESLPGKVNAAVEAALSYIEQEGLNTYDPLDLSAQEFVQRLLTVNTWSGNVVRRLIWFGAYFSPRKTRKWLEVQPKATASGVANLASLYLELDGAENRQKAKRCLDWLEQTATRTDRYIGWGFPFSWKQRSLVLAGTPIAHTTMTCGNAFLKYYRATNEDSALRKVESACDFFLYGLRRSNVGKEGLAVSYTPLDEMQIINIQADLGSLLLRTFALAGTQRHRELGMQLLEGVLETQNPDGSWCYYVPESIGKQSYIDNHHTGMVLSALAESHESAALPEGMASRVGSALVKGAEYFLTNLFTETGIPKYYSNSVYPLDTYNFAQAIITCLDLRPVLREEEKLAANCETMLPRIVENLVTEMRAGSGGFLFRKTRWAKQDLGSLRWANGLAAAALARWVRQIETGNIHNVERNPIQSA